MKLKTLDEIPTLIGAKTAVRKENLKAEAIKHIKHLIEIHSEGSWG